MTYTVYRTHAMSSDYTATLNDDFILATVNKTADITLTLPDVTACPGKFLSVTVGLFDQADQSGWKSLIVLAAGGQSLNAQVYSQYGGPPLALTILTAIRLFSDGTTWWGLT